MRRSKGRPKGAKNRHPRGAHNEQLPTPPNSNNSSRTPSHEVIPTPEIQEPWANSAPHGQHGYVGYAPEQQPQPTTADSQYYLPQFEPSGAVKTPLVQHLVVHRQLPSRAAQNLPQISTPYYNQTAGVVKNSPYDNSSRANNNLPAAQQALVFNPAVTSGHLFSTPSPAAPAHHEDTSSNLTDADGDSDPEYPQPASQADPAIDPALHSMAPNNSSPPAAPETNGDNHRSLAEVEAILEIEIPAYLATRLALDTNVQHNFPAPPATSAPTSHDGNVRSYIVNPPSPVHSGMSSNSGPTHFDDAFASTAADDNNSPPIEFDVAVTATAADDSHLADVDMTEPEWDQFINLDQCEG